MDQLVKIDKLGDAIINLTNKLADGIGWICCRETPQKIAINTYINEIQQKDYDPLMKAALISKAKQTIKEYSNQNKIVAIAMQTLQSDAEPEEIENDWLVRFMDKAKYVSSQEFQGIWGKILARECNKPGSIPPALLYTLGKMDKEDAEAFTGLCRISVKMDEEAAPVVINERFSEYKDLIGLNFDKLLSLNALGLIEMDLGAITSCYVLESDQLPAVVTYYGKKYESAENLRINVGNVLFTKAGQALYQSIEAGEVDGFWEKFCIPFWKETELV